MEEEKAHQCNETYHLEQIYFYLTEGCNLSCRHCWLSPKLQDKDIKYPVLSIELFKSILDQGKELGVRYIKLTGGEPLMHPGISEILDYIIEKKCAVSIESNGVLCTPEIANKIALSRGALVSISLDGSDKVTHQMIRGIDGCFDKAVNGIKNLVKAGIKTQVIFTIMDSNKHQLTEIVEMSESLGVDSVKFNIVQPTGRGKKLNEEGNALSVEELLELSKTIINPLADSVKLKLYFDLPVAFRPLSQMFGKNNDGCATCSILKIIGVLANGNYALCGIGSHIPELVFADAASSPLKEVWENNEILHELRHGIPGRFEGICGGCHMKRMCSASCIAQNYYRSNRLWAPFWFCDEAYQKGFFPKSRISSKSL